WGLRVDSDSGLELSTTFWSWLIEGGPVNVFHANRRLRRFANVADNVTEGSTSVNVCAKDEVAGNDCSLFSSVRCHAADDSRRHTPFVHNTAPPAFCAVLRFSNEFDWAGSSTVNAPSASAARVRASEVLFVH